MSDVGRPCQPRAKIWQLNSAQFQIMSYASLALGFSCAAKTTLCLYGNQLSRRQNACGCPTERNLFLKHFDCRASLSKAPFGRSEIAAAVVSLENVTRDHRYA